MAESLVLIIVPYWKCTEKGQKAQDSRRKRYSLTVKLQNENDLTQDSSKNAQKMFTFLDDKKNLRHLIENSNNERVNVKIGSEIDAEELKNCSLVTVNYSINNKPAGKLGVIGPKRMDYAKVIASLDYISSEIDRILYHMYIGESEE